MMATRRRVLATGGGGIAALALPGRPGAAAVEIVEMRGTVRGERIWFAPLGLVVAPETVLRFVNRDRGNSHTATCYHPDLFGRDRRIPAAAAPWDSGFLLPEEGFEVRLTVPGVYDYYCIPHEMAGMAGRIIVGGPGDSGFEGPAGDGGDIDPPALAALPAFDALLARGRIAGGEGE